MYSKDLISVAAFHDRFGLPNNRMPAPMTQSMKDFRIPFLREECAEFEEAWRDKNLVLAADALFDLAYVAIGTALFIGMEERHRFYLPSFIDVKWAAKEYGLIVQRKPKFMPIGMHMHFTAVLKSRIQLFELAHAAAEAGELNSLDVALLNLRDLVNACHVCSALMGVPWDLCFNHVQDANMAKKRASSDGSDSKRGTPWDVVKPAGWIAPDALIARTLLEHGWEVAEQDIDINFATGKVALLKREVV